MKKIMLVFGTRPEGIKMCPLVRECKKRDRFETVVCATGQHRELLEQVLEVFGVVPEYNLDVMRESQSLFDITVNILEKIKVVLEQEKPDIVLVHGDTATSFAAALSCYYLKIPVGHVEAGLRTHNIYSPHPEEFNRQAVGIIAKYNFVPTEVSRLNLVSEGKDSGNIYVTGNTVIEAINMTVKPEFRHELLEWVNRSKFILVTAHRRENIGERMRNMFLAILDIVRDNSDIKVIFPLHKNCCVREIAGEILAGCERIKLVESLDVIQFHNILARCYFVLTDSGGIQEEAIALKKPALVMRDTTERTDGLDAGVIKLVGTERKTIYDGVSQLLHDKAQYESMSAGYDYGDGLACKRIADILERELK